MVKTLIRADRGAASIAVWVGLSLLVGFLLFWTTACDPEIEEGPGNSGTSSTEAQGAGSGDVTAAVGKTVKVGNARVTVNALQETFHPVQPGQRLSEQTPSAPAGGESFYQAYVRVENVGVEPVRVDPADFTCLVKNTVVAIEVTRSGPPARSLLKNASLDLILTFEAEAGFAPELRYDPPWYDGTVRVTSAAEETIDGATDGASSDGGQESTTTD